MPLHARSRRRKSAKVHVPHAVRELRAAMAMRMLKTRDAASLARVNYTSAVNVLNGRTVNPNVLNAIREAVLREPVPA